MHTVFLLDFAFSFAFTGLNTLVSSPSFCHCCFACLQSFPNIHSLFKFRSLLKFVVPFLFRVLRFSLTSTYFACCISPQISFTLTDFMVSFTPSVFTGFARVHLASFAFTSFRFLPLASPLIYKGYFFCIFEMLYLYAWDAFCMLEILSVLKCFMCILGNIC